LHYTNALPEDAVSDFFIPQMKCPYVTDITEIGDCGNYTRIPNSDGLYDEKKMAFYYPHEN